MPESYRGGGAARKGLKITSAFPAGILVRNRAIARAEAYQAVKCPNSAQIRHGTDCRARTSKALRPTIEKEDDRARDSGRRSGLGPSLRFFLLGFLGAGGLLTLSCHFQQFLGPFGDLADQFFGMGPAGLGGAAGGFRALLCCLIFYTSFAATSTEGYCCGVFLCHCAPVLPCFSLCKCEAVGNSMKTHRI